MAQMTMIQAITDALRTELKNDADVLVFGEDVGVNGGVFRATEGLQAEFGEERVFDTPLAESGIGGLAIGLGLQGFRPVMEIQFFGFVYEVMDAVSGQMARMRYRSGGRYHSPVTIRSPFGGGVHTPELHADSLEGLVAQQPGLKVVIPATPYDAKGLLISAIRDNDPVVFLEHMKLYRSFRQEVPEGDYTVEIGKAEVKREGSDLTMVTYGAMVHECLKAADELEKEGISAEVVDLRTLYPIDADTIINSVKKTRKCLIVTEEPKNNSFAQALSGKIQERCFQYLDAPVMTIGSESMPAIPLNSTLEETMIPSTKKVKAKILELFEY